MEARAIVTNPRTIARNHANDLPDYPERMATAVAQATGAGAAGRSSALLTNDTGYVVLAQLVDPAVARTLEHDFVEIAEERREDRQYPAGSLASNLIGAATWDADGLKLTGRIGLESSQENLLAGSDGLRVVDTAEGSNTVIPGSTRFERAAVPGLEPAADRSTPTCSSRCSRRSPDYVAQTGAKRRRRRSSSTPAPAGARAGQR